jgi:hypothetical protein
MTERLEFPPLPQWFTAGREDRVPSRIRPFGGSGKDLEVAFRLARRPDVITELLALCCEAAGGRPVDPDVWLQLPVGMRIEALISLASLSDGAPFVWRLPCESESCANAEEENQFQLTLSQILSVAAEKRDFETETIPIGQSHATFRRPTGCDQMRWLEQGTATEAEAMLRSLLIEPPLEELLQTMPDTASVAAALDEAMDNFDPVVGFHVSVVCPRCGAQKDVWPDLAGAALERLSSAQRKAIEEVHRLATQYHWSESQILDLPPWRRQSYLDLIEAGAR